MSNTEEIRELEILQGISDACFEVSEKLSLTTQELIVAVAANLGRFVVAANEENPEAPVEEWQKLALSVFEAGINAKQQD